MNMSPFETALDIRFNDSNMRSSKRVEKRLSMSKKQRGLKAYGDVQDQQVKQTTDPQRLIKLLFDKACVLVRASTESLDREIKSPSRNHVSTRYK